ncbi:MAG: hypothetical protein GXP31_10740 [Kiritimatiellaeota bacterium]|nr:hypothetical protein [Kiritimatiellota bacterium]
MSPIKPFLSTSVGRRPRSAIFLSGTGTNAEQLLRRRRRAGPDAPFDVAVLVTDAPATSRARELGRKFELPVIEHDIRNFYRRRGETRVTIATEAGRRIREEWTDELRKRLVPFEVDFGILAGFVPLTNITADFPCLNVHPGDLTYIKNGRRWLVGLHTTPIERALLENLPYLRSSVIVALPYSGSGEDMDSGPILGLSPEVPVQRGDSTLEELRRCAEQRPTKRPKGGFGDRLEFLAREHLDRLKEHGDWVVLPEVAFDFGRGRFARDEAGGLYYRVGNDWKPVSTVLYRGDGRKELLFRRPTSA